MDENENLPANLAEQRLAATTEKRGSLVARGMAAVLTHNQQTLAKANDTLYREARTIFDEWSGEEVGVRKRTWRDWIWNGAENPDLFESFEMFKLLANNNYGKSYYPLSLLYSLCSNAESGQNRYQNFAQLAMEWCLANQANRDIELWCDLGDMYRQGHSIETDFAQAAYWYHKAAEQGFVRAQYNLGVMYSQGEGVMHDYVQAAEWFGKSGDQGIAKAQFNLGVMYKQGLGVPQSHAQAARWFCKAAAQGVAKAQQYLDESGIHWENT